ncbi:cell division protein ZapE [Pacificimonas flava]|uniref:Cell division protein ZapE n=2 Tax=Pacificimonas TaxID=1960290 RepID=A0A219B1F7_9SPHN|nr:MULTISPECIES: cell division protein ZapE [Pacificimonas]MBZ6378180.1 AFG1 family ATPase [Pacificimonas aurantium]OWV32192.1 cell division protein ZapE [Pacificimonas flava]
MTGTLSAYKALVEAGELRPDPDQEGAAVRLDELEGELEAGHETPGLMKRLFGGGSAAKVPRGIYMWGEVGRGKSMLMDLFFAEADIERKRRVHFAAFMLEAHAAMKTARGEGQDAMSAVIEKVAGEARLLCFDEMQVTNVVDAMILSRLFTALFEAGVTVVATSNRPPKDLYKDGLNRQLFLPFIDLLEARLDIVCLNGPTDYRLERLAGMQTYYVPNGEAATEALSEAFFRLTDYPPEDRAHVGGCDIEVGGGRTLHVPKALKGVGVFSFKRLCGEARGSADYIAVAQSFHTVILVGVPVMGPDMRNEAARFVQLVDALYNYRVKLLMSADAEPENLYPAGDGSFEFKRTVSRLMEMKSADYMAAGHGLDEAAET